MHHHPIRRRDRVVQDGEARAQLAARNVVGRQSALDAVRVAGQQEGGAPALAVDVVACGEVACQAGGEELARCEAGGGEEGAESGGAGEDGDGGFEGAVFGLGD